MEDDEKYKLIEMYKSMIEVNNKVISSVTKHESELLEIMTVDEVGTILLLANNDIDIIQSKIEVVKNQLMDRIDELNIHGVYN